jgi:hypothetical protein
LPDHDKCQQHAAALLGISVVTSSIMLVVLHVLSVPQEFFHCVRRVAEDRMGRHATTRSPRPEGPTAQRESDRSSWNGIKRQVVVTAAAKEEGAIMERGTHRCLASRDSPSLLCSTELAVLGLHAAARRAQRRRAEFSGHCMCP